MSDATDQQGHGQADVNDRATIDGAWAAFDTQSSASKNHRADAATRDRIEQAAAACGIDKLHWYGPTQCIKLAAKLQGGDLAGCWFADRADVVAFLAAVPDQCDGILKSRAMFRVANDKASDDLHSGGDTNSVSKSPSAPSQPSSATSKNKLITFNLKDVAIGINSAHTHQRRHQIRAAALLSFFAVLCVLVFLAVFWKTSL